MRSVAFLLILASASAAALGRARAEDGAVSGAPADLRASVLAVVEDDDALGALFRGLVDRGDDRGILQAAEIVLERRETSVLGWQYRGYAAQRLGSPSVARRAYERCIELDGTHWWAMTQLGHILTTAAEFDLAVKHLSRAVELSPETADGWRKLVLAQRDRNTPRDALESARKTAERGVDPTWAHVAVASLCWELGLYDESMAAWAEAEAAGADGDEVRRGRELVAFDRSPVDGEEPGDVLARRLGQGAPWRFRVGCVRVVTRVGPTLPEPDLRFLREAQQRHVEFLGGEDTSPGDVWLHLARTNAEHEVARRRLYPGGTRGRAYTERPVGGRQGPGAPVMRICLAAPDLHRSISHELVHALLIRQRAAVPTALEEGIATYLEDVDEDGGEGRSRTDLVDLLRATLEEDHLESWEAMLRLTSTGFTGPPARRRYAQAWSMIHFLVHGTRSEPGTPGTGEARLRELLATRVRRDRSGRRSGSGPSWEAAYGRTQAELESAWVEHVRTLVGR